MTIFENIVTNENTFTELFKNLMRFEGFRNEFLSLIECDFSQEAIDFDCFSTQKSTDNGRPDLVISTHNIEIFIEIKVGNATLTENQPKGYLKELESVNKSKKLLILLAPSKYNQLGKYNKCIESYNNEKKAIKIKSQTIFWSDVIASIDQKELFKGNSLLTEFRELLKEWFEPQRIIIDSKFTKRMHNIDTPKSLEKLTNIITQVKNELKKNNIKISSTKTSFLNEYGFYCNDDKHNTYQFFIGEWFQYWKETGNPFCIAIKTNDKNISQNFISECQLQELNTPELFNNTKWLTCNIELPTDEKGLFVENISVKLTSIIEKLQNTHYK